MAAATEPPEDPETLVVGVRIPRCFRMLLTPTKYMICNTAQQHTRLSRGGFLIVIVSFGWFKRLHGE
jgi:hypothetical protein